MTDTDLDHTRKRLEQAVAQATSVLADLRDPLPFHGTKTNEELLVSEIEDLTQTASQYLRAERPAQPPRRAAPPV